MCENTLTLHKHTPQSILQESQRHKVSHRSYNVDRLLPGPPHVLLHLIEGRLDLYLALLHHTQLCLQQGEILHTTHNYTPNDKSRAFRPGIRTYGSASQARTGSVADLSFPDCIFFQVIGRRHILTLLPSITGSSACR